MRAAAVSNAPGPTPESTESPLARIGEVVNLVAIEVLRAVRKPRSDAFYRVLAKKSVIAVVGCPKNNVTGSLCPLARRRPIPILTPTMYNHRGSLCLKAHGRGSLH